MTPASRLSAAIDILDRVLSGTPAELALTQWARGNRYAGSGDRLALRDLVYDALRRRRSAAWVGGGRETGRALVLGTLRLAGQDPAPLFTGERFAPAPMTGDDAGRALSDAPDAIRLDVPDWLLPRLRTDLGDAADEVLEVMRHRAPVWLRVNSRRASVAAVAEALRAEGIGTRPHDHFKFALEATDNARKARSSQAFSEGLFEFQDAHSQAMTLLLGEVGGLPVLDYCAGGGGKALHLADLGARVTAHDADPKRMRDLPARAARARVAIATAATAALPGLGPWPLVLVDAPCSGSGTWRRDPEGKWALTPDRLAGLLEAQDSVLDAASAQVAPGGRLAWVTCSLLAAENRGRIEAFLARQRGWKGTALRQFMPGASGDGFSIEILARSPQG